MSHKVTSQCKVVSLAKNVCSPYIALLVPVLIRHPIRKEVVANFDPIIYQLIRETEVMKKMGLDVPDEGQRLLYMQKMLKEKHSKLVVSTIILSVAGYSGITEFLNRHMSNNSVYSCVCAEIEHVSFVHRCC